MASCVTCSAPLPSGVDLCRYCGSKHDTDFHGVHRYTVSQPVSERTCPRCEDPLQTINLKSDGKFYIERCDKCMGIFFDPGELEALLENSVTNVFEINQRRMDSVNQDLYKRVSNVKYLKCPECSSFMRRTNFGSRSGVIVDKCRDHGVWLDGGELNRLMEWKKSGGELLHEKLKAEKEKSEAKKTCNGDKNTTIAGIVSNHNNSQSWGTYDNDEDLISSVSNIVMHLFR